MAATLTRRLELILPAVTESIVRFGMVEGKNKALGLRKHRYQIPDFLGMTSHRLGLAMNHGSIAEIFAKVIMPVWHGHIVQLDSTDLGMKHSACKKMPNQPMYLTPVVNPALKNKEIDKNQGALVNATNRRSNKKFPFQPPPSGAGSIPSIFQCNPPIRNTGKTTK